nr:WhiB family transcriptional regulator [Nakamurella sp. PAMC28650]
MPEQGVVPEQNVVPEQGVVRHTTDEFCVDPPSDVLSIGSAEWTLRAVCVGVDPDALFVTGAAQRDAAKVCQACPVRLECLADALDNQIEYGVWGGMTERQRRAVLKKSPEVLSWRLVLEEARASATQEAAS